MNYEQAYKQLISVVMDDIDNISIDAAKQVQKIHESLSVEPSSDKQGITSDEWNKMTYQERVDLKTNNPEAYQNVLRGKFE